MKAALCNGRYPGIWPDHIADWDAVTGWEKTRFASMEERLRPGMRLLDVGAEHGWISQIYAGFVGGGDNMILLEPHPAMWPNIRLIWEHNGLASPVATVRALCGDSLDLHKGDEWMVVRGWVAEAMASDVEQPATSYQYLHEPSHVAATSTVTIDWLTGPVGLQVDAITMDIEGAELVALRGATMTLARGLYTGLDVWVSIHPDLAERDYGVTDGAVQDFMRDQGYHGVHLGTDHEQHWLFRPA